jgi:putative DNA primase/helicase
LHLYVPDIPDDCDILRAALLYAEAGWYVVAVEPDTKRPAKFYGRLWQKQTSRDPQEIASWFAGANYLLGLHMGRSGGICFDVDAPERLPDILVRAFTECHPIVQSTRVEGARGHRLFAVPEGLRFGNGLGGLKTEPNWGEIRGQNGLIVVEPSPHWMSADGGRYKFLNPGPLPELADYIAKLLPEPSKDVDVATESDIMRFVSQYSSRATKPRLANAILEKFSTAMQSGSRHEALVKHLVWAMRECRVGYFQANVIIPTMLSMFSAALQRESAEGTRFPKAEFRGALAWAVSQAMLDDPEQRQADNKKRLSPTSALVGAAETRRAAHIAIEPPKERPPAIREPKTYFIKGHGVDMALLPNDVMSLGELIVGADKEFWSYEGGVWSRNIHEVEERMVALMGSRYSKGHLGSVESVIRAKVGRLNCEPVPDYINMSNGMLDWRTGDLSPHSPHFGSTVQLPVDWDKRASCPNFDKFLSGVLSPDYQELAWQMVAYLMYSGNPHQRAFMLLGDGNDGKGTLLRVIEALLGRRNCSFRSLSALNKDRFAAYSLFGKTANICGDISGSMQGDTDTFKRICGEDTLDGERKFGPSFSFRSWAVPVFSANRVPGSPDTSTGYLRRWMILRFNGTIPENRRIPGLSEKLAAELPGIAAKAVLRLPDLIDGSGFKRDGDVARGKEEFALSLDPVRQWYDECCVDKAEGEEDRTAVYRSYRLWAHSAGYATPLRAGDFYERMRLNGHREHKRSGRRFFTGFRVTDMRAIGTVGHPSAEMHVGDDPFAQMSIDS